MPRTIKILCSTDDLLVVDKPSGLVIHRSQQARDSYTLLDCLKQQLHGPVFPVNRLDRGTSGVIVLGRTREAARELSLAFQNQQVTKTYLALVRGWPEPLSIDALLDQKTAVTRTETLARFEQPWPNQRFATARYALIVAYPERGIHHQIRRHLRSAGFPVLGDGQHGDKEHNRLFETHLGISRLLLHSWRLELPYRQRVRQFTAALPGRLRGMLARLGAEQNLLNSLAESTLDAPHQHG
ncbi:MAG: RluA family pseudouridine synthase [Vulcanimicrobiota bacterium]